MCLTMWNLLRVLFWNCFSCLCTTKLLPYPFSYRTESSISDPCQFSKLDREHTLWKLFFFIFLSFLSTEDDIPPRVTCPRNIALVVPQGITGTTASWEPPNVVEESAYVLVFQTHYSGNFFEVGVTQVEYTYADQSGNVGTCTFNVFVTDGRFRFFLLKIVGFGSRGVTVYVHTHLPDYSLGRRSPAADPLSAFTHEPVP